jgi:hypothetical protein
VAVDEAANQPAMAVEPVEAVATMAVSLEEATMVASEPIWRGRWQRGDVDARVGVGGCIFDVGGISGGGGGWGGGYVGRQYPRCNGCIGGGGGRDGSSRGADKARHAMIGRASKMRSTVA